MIPEGQNLSLKDTANLSSGGTAIDVTCNVHPYNIALAERIARLIELNICGLDIIAEDISVPINENNGALLEINASPGLRMHCVHPKVKAETLQHRSSKCFSLIMMTEEYQSLLLQEQTVRQQLRGLLHISLKPQITL